MVTKWVLLCVLYKTLISYVVIKTAPSNVNFVQIKFINSYNVFWLLLHNLFLLVYLVFKYVNQIIYLILFFNTKVWRCVFISLYKPFKCPKIKVFANKKKFLCVFVDNIGGVTRETHKDKIIDFQVFSIAKNPRKFDYWNSLSNIFIKYMT